MPDDPTADEVERYYTNRESLPPERLAVLQEYAERLPRAEQYFQKSRAALMQMDREIGEAIRNKKIGL